MFEGMTVPVDSTASSWRNGLLGWESKLCAEAPFKCESVRPGHAEHVLQQVSTRGGRREWETEAEAKPK